ncbi:hypothetical protein AAIH46_10720 [Rhizobium sp. 0TCS1.26]|uniref:hypothetical protein n=1 Tax=Rhizobium sp. 0TCS1.26 TaxID=3142623 RepID=UPI003D2B7D56
MRIEYKAALAAAGYQDNTIAAQLHRVGKVEQFYGSLDDIAASGGYEALIADLTYSTADERARKINPSRIPFEGNVRNNLQSYKNAVARYFQFLHAQLDPTQAIDGRAPTTAPMPDIVEKQRLSLERDMQTALRRNISLLETGLTIADDGIERSPLRLHRHPVPRFRRLLRHCRAEGRQDRCTRYRPDPSATWAICRRKKRRGCAGSSSLTISISGAGRRQRLCPTLRCFATRSPFSSTERDRPSCKPPSPPSSWRIRMWRNPKRSCAAASIAVSAPPPVPPM